ncbi:GMC family oxidoreductase [Salinirubellus salinus]|uniref:GMC family oxidoreductase n=1 Tax=Salinirubellus salinus TaxID=1364945 RepID=A0A9E7R129_9EURY|nr:GMC family oxidoreductase [Salinirubellus salinus]UWM53593.1 GMC family oxidoreductase [Salinirubellus salinus]
MTRRFRARRSAANVPDVCVVGSGPGGALVADSLAARGHDVVVLEAGPRFDLEDRMERMRRALHPGSTFQAVWDMGGPRDAYSTSGEQAYSLNTSRVKGVGGTSLHWGGMTPRLHPEDFEMRTRYGVGEDWPISYADLEPYYARAEVELGVAGADSAYAPPRSTEFPLPAHPTSHSDRLFADAFDALDIELAPVPRAVNSVPYDGRSGCVGFGTCTPVCPSGAKYDATVHAERAERRGARIVTEAPVVRLEHDATGERVTAAVYRTPDGGEHRQRARTFVLACGAVETARLLLLSTSEVYSDGLANSSGLVGRYFMEHPYVRLTGYVDEPTAPQNVGYSTSFTEQFYQHDRGPTGSVLVEPSNTAGTPLATAALVRPSRLGNAVSGRAPGLLGGGRWGDDLLADLRDEYEGLVAIGAWVEMPPEYDNHVGLDESTTDAAGNPVPDLSFGVGDAARGTLTESLDLLDGILEELGATDREAPVTPEDPWYALHHLGTTRMGTDPETSVVDPNCRTHDLSNLYVSSSSVFVTGGAANPTLTIAALALRLADHVHAERTGEKATSAR